MFFHQTVQNYLNLQYVCPMSHPGVGDKELKFVYTTLLLYTAETQNVHCEHKSISIIYYLCSLELYKLKLFFCKKTVNLEDFTSFVACCFLCCETKWWQLHTKMMLLSVHAHKRVTGEIHGYKFKVPSQWPDIVAYIHIKSEGRVNK